VIYYLSSPTEVSDMRKIELVDLKHQYLNIKSEIDVAIAEVIESTAFIGGFAVKNFKENLSKYLGGLNTIPCANGTDALQICMMALDLKPGDEVIVPSFTFAATAEVIGLLGLKPTFVDVNAQTFNIDPATIEAVITPKTKAIVVVHLFGQSADMEPVMKIAQKHNLFIIEDNAQAIGAKYTFSNGSQKFCGSIGTVASTSFFPSKNLGCYGDGGAMFSADAQLAEKMRMIANHGMNEQYYHEVIGVNSRLDGIQAAILDVKLKYLDTYNEARMKVAKKYSEALKDVPQLITPFQALNSTHVYHQYTLTVKDGSRDKLQQHLNEKLIPNKVYYPVPLHLQKAYNLNGYKNGDFPVSEELCRSVISLPMHTELDDEQINFITNTVINFYK